MRNSQQWVVFAFVVLIVGGVFVGTRLVAPAPTPARAGALPFGDTLPPGVTLRLRNVRITGRTKGTPSWKLRAGIVDSTRNVTQVSFSDGIEADFLQGGQKRATVTAPQAVYQVTTKQVMSSGGVVCQVRGAKADPAKDLKISTPEVTWNIGSRTIACPGQVEVERPGATVRGINLNIDLLSRAYTLHHFEADLDIEALSDPGQALRILPQAP